MDRLGSTGCNTMYFNKYMSSIHCDNAKTKAITAQLARETAGDDFNFAYVEWGFYVHTRTGTVWYGFDIDHGYTMLNQVFRWFDSDHYHAIIMPS